VGQHQTKRTDPERTIGDPCVKAKTKRKRFPETDRSVVYLTLVGRHLDPGKITKILHMRPDGYARRGDLFGGVKRLKYEVGFWDLKCSTPRKGSIEMKMRRILKRIAPVKERLRKLIEEDGTIEDANLTVDFDVPRGVVNANYRFNAKLVAEFTSLGIDLAISMWIPDEASKGN
jgi:hypothetical protein